MVGKIQRWRILLVLALLQINSITCDSNEVHDKDGQENALPDFVTTEWKPNFCIGPPKDKDAVRLSIRSTDDQDNEIDTWQQGAIYRTKDETKQQNNSFVLISGMCLGEIRSIEIDSLVSREMIQTLLNMEDKNHSIKKVFIELVDLQEKRWEIFPDSGLKVAHLEEIPNEKCPRLVKEDDFLSVEYEGSLEDGTVFDSSKVRGSPFGPFVMGKRQIIAGYEIALKGRCLGERFIMVVPPHLAYGDSGVGDLIPPHATLTFDVRLVQLNSDQWTENFEAQDVLRHETVQGPEKCSFRARLKDDLTIHYLAIREDGTFFGSAMDESSPYGPFRIDSGALSNVIGLERGLESMCLGERRMIFLPPRLSWKGVHDTLKVYVDLVKINTLTSEVGPPLLSLVEDQSDKELDREEL